MTRVLAFLCLTATSAFAAPRIIDPPPEYNRPWRGKMVEHSMPYSDVLRTCRNELGLTGVSGFNSYVTACQVWHGNICHIFYPMPGPSDVTPDESRRWRAHERAHCMGWPSNHSGGSNG